MHPLDHLGWHPTFQQAFEQLDGARLEPARVLRHDRAVCRVVTAHGEETARVRPGTSLVTGDWVALAPDVGAGARLVHARLPRRTVLARGASRARGESREAQTLAANVDVALLVMGLDRDFNLRRLERYLVLVAASEGVAPVVVLNKADACDDVAARVAAVRAVAPAVRVVVTSAATGAGVEELRGVVVPGATAALLGSSGVGKSSLVNRLMGEAVMPTQATREADGRGRHTTTHRELLLLPGGGVLMDTPGLRELRLWADVESVRDVFADVAELARACRFRDCAHEREPGCAVREALPAERLASYQKLLREAARADRTKVEQRRAARGFGRMARDAQEGKRRAREW